MTFPDQTAQQDIIYIFDIVGTVIFAITGGVRGIRAKLDLLGVVVLACIVGVGGGMMRDVLIGAVPVAALQDEIYLTSCLITGLIVFFLSPLVRRVRGIIEICDAFGLGVFTAIGAAKGAAAGLNFAGIILCGVITAVGGGIIRDIVTRRVPVVFTSDFYATASLLGGGLYYVLNVLPVFLFFHKFLLVMVFVSGLRLLAIRYKLSLPVSGGRTSFILFRHGKKKLQQK